MALSVGAPLALPTLYEYYTGGGIQQGLNANQSYFTLNNKNFTIYSGAMHYFRVPKAYWKDRLRRMRAAGLNTVETYIPWNLHEFEQEHFDFGDGGSDFQDFLDIKEFLDTAKSEDLFTIVRPGPYMCSEWEFGGLPSWLLREKDIKFRSSDQSFMKYVERYFKVLLPILAMFQFTKGGPIIALQVENEYANTYQPGTFEPDKVYLEKLRQMMLDYGIKELLVTSDNDFSGKGTLPGVLLETANFASDPEQKFEALKKLNGDKPSMAMEFWTGWYDHWGDDHHTRDNKNFRDVLERILKYPASFNMYMFHGGTSFGFMNGANLDNGAVNNSDFHPDTSSYDYDAPLTESGDYTEKYNITRDLINQYNSVKTKVPDPPPNNKKIAYNTTAIFNVFMLYQLTDNLPKFKSDKLLPMELLPMNNNSGQSYGYIVYRTYLDLPPNATLKISGHICDTVLVLVDGVMLNKPLEKVSDLDGFGYWRINDSTITLPNRDMKNVSLELVVENWGRNNFGGIKQFYQFKGLWQGDVYVNDKVINNWEIIPLEFKRDFNNDLMETEEGLSIKEVAALGKTDIGPALYVSGFHIADDPVDSFINMSDWHKGIVIINGFVLGRYAKIGPQQTLYLPAPLLRKGNNFISVFEHFNYHPEIRFSDKPIYKTNK